MKHEFSRLLLALAVAGAACISFAAPANDNMVDAVADLSSDGKKWQATPAKGYDTAKPKVTYAAKKGTLTGSYKATVKGSDKPVSAKITGVWLGKTGVGTAVMKVNKVTTALPVLIK